MRNLFAVFLLSICLFGCAGKPMLITPENSKEYSEGYRQGIIDGHGNAAWSLAGFGCGILGIAAAYTYSPNPPKEALEGKSTEYTMAYMEGYQSKARERNTHHAIMGMVVSVAVYLLLLTMDF